VLADYGRIEQSMAELQRAYDDRMAELNALRQQVKANVAAAVPPAAASQPQPPQEADMPTSPPVRAGRRVRTHAQHTRVSQHRSPRAALQHMAHSSSSSVCASSSHRISPSTRV
jgi:hypothetical protein